MPGVSKIRQQNYHKNLIVAIFQCIVLSSLVLVNCQIKYINDELDQSKTNSSITESQFITLKTRISQFKKQISGKSLQGVWKCGELTQDKVVMQCFYEFFRIPKSSGKPINEEKAFYVEENPLEFFDMQVDGPVQAFFWSKKGSTSDFQADQLNIVIQPSEQKYQTSKAIQINIDLSEGDQFSIHSTLYESRYLLYKLKDHIATANLYDLGQQLIRFDINIDVQISIPLQRNHDSLLSGRQKKKDAPNTNTATKKDQDDGKGEGEGEQEQEQEEDQQQQLWIQQQAQPQREIKFSKQNPLQVSVSSKSFAFNVNLSKSQPNHTIIILIALMLLPQLITVFWRRLITGKNSQVQNRRVMFRTSQWFILQTFLFVLALSLLYIRIAFSQFDTVYSKLLFIGLANIGIGLFFMRSFEMVLEKFRNRFMAAKVIAFIITYNYLIWRFHANLAASRFWVSEITLLVLWQIIHSINVGGKGGVPYPAICYASISRLPFYYVLAHENNFFQLQPLSINMLGLGFVSFAGLLIVTELQRIKGGRFFVPNEIIPDYFNYYIVQSVTSKRIFKEDCPICFTALNGKDMDEEEQNRDKNKDLGMHEGGVQMKYDNDNNKNNEISEEKSSQHDDDKNDAKKDAEAVVAKYHSDTVNAKKEIIDKLPPSSKDPSLILNNSSAVQHQNQKQQQDQQSTNNIDVKNVKARSSVSNLQSSSYQQQSTNSLMTQQSHSNFGEDEYKDNHSQNNHKHHQQLTQQSGIATASDFAASTNTDNSNDKTVRLMRTPCGHIFHIKCLTDWMQTKLVCPNCRSTLPQLESLEKEDGRSEA